MGKAVVESPLNFEEILSGREEGDVAVRESLEGFLRL